MARKYAGPLRPGEKSAYVKGTRKNKSKPPRLSSGKTSYRKSRKASDKLQQFGETKIQSLRPIDLLAPSQMNPTAIGIAPVYGVRFVIGESLPMYAQYNALEGFRWVRGTSANERVGNYMYFRRVNMTMEINMNQVGQTNSGPRRFRLIIFKARRYANPTGKTADPNEQLMMKSDGSSFGVNTVGPPQPNMLDFTHLLTNKRDFQIIRDKTFILQNSLGNPSAGGDPLISTSGQYKSSKVIKCKLALWRKTLFNNESNLPTDLNYNYGIYLQALNVGSSTAIPDDWTVSVRGTVSANDV